MLKSRESFALIQSFINEKLYSREFQIVKGFVKDYYERDAKAQEVDLGLLGELISSEILNEKHAAKFAELAQEAYAFDTSSGNVKQVILNAKKRELAIELASAIANEKPHDALVESYGDLLKYTDLDALVEDGAEVYTADSLDDLLNHQRQGIMTLYPLSLNEKCDGGVGPSDHVVIIARPETGKTALVLTLACGFARQGFPGIVFSNEENIQKLRRRALYCCTGMNKQEVDADPERAKRLANEMGYHNIIFISLSPGTPEQVEAFVKKFGAKWFFMDQIRNLAMRSENRTGQLEMAAQAMRNIAKRYGAAAFSITQAGDSASGKSILDMGDVDGSNTGIPGACDVLLGIGATEEQKAQGIRVLSLSKNKLGGVHDSFPVRFNQWISKYVSIS